MENMEADDLHPSTVEMEADEDACSGLQSDGLQKMESEISTPADDMEVLMQNESARGSRKRTFDDMTFKDDTSGSSNVLIINGDDSLESGVFRRERRNHEIAPPTYTKSSFNFLSSGQLQTTINYKVIYTRSMEALRSPRALKPPPVENPLPVVQEDSPQEVQYVFVREKSLLSSDEEEHIMRMRCRDWTKFTNKKNNNEDKK